MDEVFGVETGMGEVAASSAGDADFVEGMAAGFEDGDVEVGVVAGGGDGPKKSGGPAADDDCVARLVVNGYIGRAYSISILLRMASNSETST